jgi:cell wall-associated NlpC family hydrolase
VPRERERHGVVQLAALDLRRRPDHRAELTSQLLMGEVVRVLERDRNDQWWRVENEADGYAGWVRSYGLRPASRTRTRRWLQLARGRVVAPFCHVRSARRGGHSLTPLFWNGRVIAGRATAGRRSVELPDGRRGWVEASAVSIGPNRVGVLDRIRDLLGTPYLWGGRTPHGLDCSGLVQQLLGEQGVALPRDAHDQYLLTRRNIAPADLAPGDLVFFGRGPRRMEHVGLLLGGGYYVHARGVVRVNSLDPDNPFYDKPLAAQTRGFGRTKQGSKIGIR